MVAGVPAGLRASPQHAVGHFSERLDAKWTFARWWLAEKFRPNRRLRLIVESEMWFQAAFIDEGASSAVVVWNGPGEILVHSPARSRRRPVQEYGPPHWGD
jgi:hypothetical protein